MKHQEELAATRVSHPQCTCRANGLAGNPCRVVQSVRLPQEPLLRCVSGKKRANSMASDWRKTLQEGGSRPEAGCFRQPGRGVSVRIAIDDARHDLTIPATKRKVQF